MELSKRLKAVASLVTDGYRLADIGTDHAYIPIFLVRTGRIQEAVAMDVNKGPLLRAEENIRSYGLERQIRTRISNGFAALRGNEADSAVIAGMGGSLMICILQDGAEAVSSLKECILQPQSEIEKVRAFLLEEGFFFLCEDMVEEDGKYYPMMKVIPPRNVCDMKEKGRAVLQQSGRMTDQMEHYEETWDEAELRYGKLLLKDKNPVLREYLEREIRIRSRILNELKDNNSEKAAVRRQELKKELKIAEKGMEYYAV